MDALVKLRVATTDLERWRAQAQTCGLSLSAWVRLRCNGAPTVEPVSLPAVPPVPLLTPAAPVTAPVVRPLVPLTSAPVTAPAPSRVRLNLLALSTPEHCARADTHRAGVYCKACGATG
jgi:hypothetical protein